MAGLLLFPLPFSLLLSASERESATKWRCQVTVREVGWPAHEVKDETNARAGFDAWEGLGRCDILATP